MFTSRSTFIFFFVLCGVICTQSETTAKKNCPEECLIRFRCDIYSSGPKVWSVVDGVCKIFKNNCLFENTKCNRKTDCLSDIEKTTKERCKIYCARHCRFGKKQPVCASYAELANGTRRDESVTYPSQCELDRQTCLTERPYISVFEGVCSSIS